MKAGLQQSARLGQELKVNPRLYQAMDMLYMPLLDLQQHLKQELLVNPFLELIEEEEEEVEPGEETAAEADAQQEAETGETTAPADSDDESQWEEILLNGFEVGGVREERDDREHYEPTTVATTGLDDHLREQVRMLDLSERDELLAEEFIGNINEDGWLASTLEELLVGINAEIARAAEASSDEREAPLFTMAEAERMLQLIQTLDPPGIAARTLHECLVLQLKDSGLVGTLSERLVRDHFPVLIAHRWVEIGRKLGIPPGEVQTAADAIAKLNPKPGRAYAEGGDNYVVPDLIVEKVEGEYLVFINDANLPRLKLSKSYQDIARDKKKFDGESKEFITSRLSAAQWLIQAIEQRRQTMLKVMHFIVDRQREFFEKGEQALRPLTLREVAEAIGMHESTVSRVTNEKFAQTPRGVLPLKYFFSSAPTSSEGEAVSARAIRATIEKLVADEDPKHPLTDQAPVDLPERDRVQIAHRTVAQYRHQPRVPPARLRKPP